MLKTENERVKTKFADTDTIRISQSTIQHLKNAAGNHPVSWDIGINRILGAYYSQQEKSTGINGSRLLVEIKDELLFFVASVMAPSAATILLLHQDSFFVASIVYVVVVPLSSRQSPCKF